LFKKKDLKIMKIKIGDTVKIIAGKDKGRTGKVEKVMPKSNKVIVPEINLYKKHVKGNQGIKAGVYDVPRPLNVAKVALICPNCKKETRVNYKFIKDEKLRICAKCKKEINKA